VSGPLRPDDEDKPFAPRWNLLTRVLLVEPSVKLVARIAMDYADFDDGSSCFPSIERLARETGLSDRTVRNGWAVLRGLKMAVRVSRGGSFRGAADEYQLEIPDDWQSMPTLGPHAKKFTCPGCGNRFNPDAHSILNDRTKDKTKPDGKPRAKAGDSVAWVIGRLAFCSWPSTTRGGRKGSSACRIAWDEKQRGSSGKLWDQLDGEGKWTIFREARDDSW
jgi:hypothetical protein